MKNRKLTYFRNSVDLRDKVQVKILRKRLKLSDVQFASIVQKSGNSIAAIAKEAAVAGLTESRVTEGAEVA
jgi:DNA-binding transcriptional regulator YiaG